MPRHETAHRFAWQTVPIVRGHYAGQSIHLEDWFDRVAGCSWMDAGGNPAALKYGVRAGLHKLPLDDAVVYGKIGGSGEVLHESELGDAPQAAQVAA